MIEALWWAYEGHLEDFPQRVETALEQGCFDLEGLKHLRRTLQTASQKIPSLDNLGKLIQFEKPAGSLDHYNQLIS